MPLNVYCLLGPLPWKLTWSHVKLCRTKRQLLNLRTTSLFLLSSRNVTAPHKDPQAPTVHVTFHFFLSSPPHPVYQLVWCIILLSVQPSHFSILTAVDLAQTPIFDLNYYSILSPFAKRNLPLKKSNLCLLTSLLKIFQWVPISSRI